MSALVNALDNHTSKQIGENGHAEYGWSNSIRERILQFSFQLTRTDERGLNKLAIVLCDILHTLKAQQTSSSEVVVTEYLIILYKMIGQTRDIVDGKGECSLTYMMIYTWFQFYPELALYAVKCLVYFIGNTTTHQYGSWKDIKYFSSYCYKNGCTLDHPLIQHTISIVNAQINMDYANLISNSDDLSLAGKWVPREKSGRFGWMYEALACNYFPIYLETSSEKSKPAAILKAKMDYRKILSSLNRKIDTLQIKQCDNTWTKIDFKKVTSVSLSKQRKAFLNVTKKGEPRFPDNHDRVECAVHFNEHIQKAVRGEVEMKGKRVAEKSKLGKRVMTFSSTPKWVNLEGHDGFVSMVQTLRQADWGMSTNFDAALNMILDTIVETKMEPEDVEGLTLAIFSDMQMDSADSVNRDTNVLYDRIRSKYADAGLRVKGKPYKPPHILFWNLRSTSGFPTLSSQQNASMMSGFSPVMLNLFCEQGIESLQAASPWSLFLKSLENERYSIMETRARDFFV